MSFSFGIVKEVGEEDVVLVVGSKEYVITLNKTEIDSLHHVLSNNDDTLIPFDEESMTLQLDKASKIHQTESNLEELIDDDDIELDEEGKVK